MKEESRRRQGDAQGTDKHAAEPESLSLGQKRDRADHQPYLQKRLSTIKAVGLPNRQIALLFQILRLFADINFVAFIMLDFFRVFLFQFLANSLFSGATSLTTSENPCASCRRTLFAWYCVQRLAASVSRLNPSVCAR